MNKILVTGGAGFIGSHLVRTLQKHQNQVVVFDNLSGGYLENIPPDVEFVLGDIIDENAINKLFNDYKFDYVYHLAAYAAEGLSHFIRNFNYRNNVIGSINLINCAIKHQVKKFIFTSSMGVYGTNQVPFDEDMKPSPEDPYGIAKYTIEQDLLAAKKMFGLNYTIFRPHNVYGSCQNIWDKYRNVVGIFMNQLLNDQPMTIFGDGQQIRAFSHIDDIVPALARGIESSLNGEIINIGGEQPITINELSISIANIMKKDRKFVHLPTRYEVKNAFSTHKKLQKLLGIYPNVSLKEGLTEMSKWASENYKKRISKDFFSFEQTINLPSKWIAK